VVVTPQSALLFSEPPRVKLNSDHLDDGWELCWIKRVDVSSHLEKDTWGEAEDTKHHPKIQKVTTWQFPRSSLVNAI
jgi:hypothetical protein